MIGLDAGPSMSYRGIDLTETTAGILEHSFAPSTKGFVALHGFAGVAQSWASGASPSELTGVAVSFNPNGVEPHHLLQASVYAHSGTFGTSSVPTGAALASSAIYATDTISGAETWYFFPLSGWTPTAATNYVVAFQQLGPAYGDGNNGVLAITDAVTGNDGNYAVETLDLSAWNSVAGTDLGFRVYSATGGAGSTGPNEGWATGSPSAGWKGGLAFGIALILAACVNGTPVGPDYAENCIPTVWTTWDGYELVEDSVTVECLGFLEEIIR